MNFHQDLMADMRGAIATGKLDDFAETFAAEQGQEAAVDSE